MSRPRGSPVLGFNQPVLAFYRQLKRATNYDRRTKLYAMALVRPYARLAKLNLNQGVELAEYLLCIIEAYRWKQVLFTANVDTPSGRTQYAYASRMVAQYSERASKAKRIKDLTDAHRKSKDKHGPMRDVPPTRLTNSIPRPAAESVAS